MPATELSIQEELSQTGIATGIEREVEDLSATEEIAEPFDPEKIDVATRNMTIDLLMSRIRSGAINLEPEFQRRRGIWTDERQSRLIESILLRIPLPTLYAAEDQEENWAIVDGIQRLTAIGRFVDPSAVGDKYLTLSGLEYLRDYKNYRFADLPPKLQRRIRETELVVHLIRHGTPEAAKYNIFARINTGGLPLSPQELRHALVPGRARNILKEWAECEAFKKATADSIRDDRMGDRELVLRFVAFRLTPYGQYRPYDFDRFLTEAMRSMNLLPEEDIRRLEREFQRAMKTAHSIFRDDAFRKRYRPNEPRHPINKALFETIAVNLAALSSEERKTLIQRKQTVREGLMRLMSYRSFDVAISQGTSDINKVKTRFSRVEKLFREVLK